MKDSKMHYTSPFHYHGFADQFVGRFLLKFFADRTDSVIIAVGGPGGSGKSTFCERLAAELKDSAILTTDDYKVPRHERPDGLFGSHPDANKLHLLREHLGNIRKRVSFDHPLYDDKTGEIHQSRRFEPAKYNLIDGEIATFDGIRELADFIIYIDADWVTQLHARITRDVNERFSTPEKAINMFLQSNLKDHPEVGAKTREWADITLCCREDRHIIIQSVAEKYRKNLEQLRREDETRLNFRGLIVPITTPFDDMLKIDEKAFIAHLHYLRDAGVTRILVNGTTGEFFSLRPGERRHLLKLTRRHFDGLLIFQAGCEGLAQTMEQCAWAHDFGADAVLVLPPYYYASVESEGLIAYFQQLVEMLRIPLMLYNFPKHTNVTFTPEMLIRIPHVAFKDSSADLSLISHTPAYFVGGDRKILTAIRQGAVGFVSARANAIPEPYVRMENAIHRNVMNKATEVQKEINRIQQSLGSPNDIQKIKIALSEELPGYPVAVRLPLMQQ